MRKHLSLAIVGSREFITPREIREVKDVIGDTLDSFRPRELVSGGASGVDTWAAEAAAERGIPVKEYLPRNYRWEPDGFKDRNEAIALRCDELVAIRSRHSKTYGSGWTADEAERRGREVHRIVI